MRHIKPLYDWQKEAFKNGDRGELLFQLEMLELNVESDILNYTYDILLLKNGYRIEVKTGQYRRLKSNRQVMGDYAFAFTPNQIKKNAFDYAVCYGMQDKQIKRTWVIPQEYIYREFKDEPKKEHYYIRIADGPHKQIIANFTAQHWNKYKCCLNKLDILTQDNRRLFTRKKNYLTNRLINYEKKCKEQLNKQILNLWNEGYNKKEIRDKLQIGTQTVLDACNEMGLPRLNPKTQNSLFETGNARLIKAMHTRLDNIKKEDKRITPLVLSLWNKGHTRQEIEKLLEKNSQVIRRIANDLSLPKHNPNRNKQNTIEVNNGS